MKPSVVAKATFMEANGMFNRYQDDVVSILELPYKSKDFSMLVLLPKGDLSEFYTYLSWENFSLWVNGLQQTHFKTIKIPRYKIEQETDVVTLLQGLGMLDAFEETKANFSGISREERLFIKGIFHKAFIEVNEEGTEAAAATAVVMSRRSMGPPRDQIFIANKPFVFTILHKPTQSIIFLGSVVNPE